MFGGVKITKQTSIFNLIENPLARVNDLETLIDLAPEKLNNIKDKMNPLDFAIMLSRNDMAALLRLNGLKETVDLFDAILDNVKNNKSVNMLKEIIQDKDLSSMPENQQLKIMEHLSVSPDFVDEKMKELTEHKLFNNIGKIGSIHILFDNTDNSLSLFKVGLKNGASSKNKVGTQYTILAYIIETCFEEDILERIKLVIQHGADVKYIGPGDKTYFDNLHSRKKPVDFYKVFVDAGLDINTKLSGQLPLTFMAIQTKKKDLFDFAIREGADVNIKLNGKSALVMASAFSNNLYFVKELIEHGADINAVDNQNGTALMFAIEYAINEESVNIIQYLLEKGADKTIKLNTVPPRTAVDIAYKKYDTNPTIYKKILTLLGEKVKEEELWKGSTRSDIEKYDIFFEKPFDYSCCPICLEYIERKEGCMYMSHNCAARNNHYHKKLYDTFSYSKYEGASNEVEWCTVCGRVTKIHKHYVLSSANAPSTTLAPLKPEIQAQIDAQQNVVFFDNANCVGFGGGGTLEKAARFRRLREYTLELQEDVGKKKHTDAMDELIEEIFNAPLIRNRKIEKILEDKKWNINIKEFPENVRNTRNNNANRNYANIPFEGVLPTLLPSKDHNCIIYGDDDEGKEENPIVHFHHETRGGMNHKDIDICQKDLARAIEVANKEFGEERFGKCWFPQCHANLHPEELKGFIPEVLYLDYKKKFNKKMAKAGGNRNTRKNNNSKKNNSKNNQSVLHKLDLDTVTCSLPNYTKNGKLRKI